MQVPPPSDTRELISMPNWTECRRIELALDLFNPGYGKFAVHCNSKMHINTIKSVHTVILLFNSRIIVYAREITCRSDWPRRPVHFISAAR